MKFKDVILIVAIVSLIANFTQFLNPKVETKIETEYIKGDTVVKWETKIESLYIPYPVTIKADTVYHSDSTCYAQSDFDIKQDSVSVSGVVTYLDSIFTFNNVEILYPQLTKIVTSVDTLLKTITITKENPFYSNMWFWGTILSVALLVLQALK